MNAHTLATILRAGFRVLGRSVRGRLLVRHNTTGAVVELPELPTIAANESKGIQFRYSA